jgi:uncharacterized protein YjbJ (UPF0337 family)
MGELIDKTKGKAKEAVGEATNNRDLQAEGELDQAKGKAKGAFEDVKKDIKDAVDPDAPRRS